MQWFENGWRFIRDVYSDFSSDNGGLMAAAISFYATVSLLPLLLLAVSVGAFVLGSPERAQSLVQSFVREYMPNLTQQGKAAVQTAVEGVVRGRGAATGIGLLVLLWTGTGLITNLALAIDVAWDLEPRRGFAKRRLIAAGLLGATILLLGASVGLTTLLDIVRNSKVTMFGLRAGDIPFIWAALGYLVPLLVTIAAFTLIYVILPNARVRLVTALVGGAFAGVLWELAKIGYSFYLRCFAAHNQIYGSLGGALLLLAWINYTSIITILGAEVASVWSRRREPVQKCRGGKTDLP